MHVKFLPKAYSEAYAKESNKLYRLNTFITILLKLNRATESNREDVGNKGGGN